MSEILDRWRISAFGPASYWLILSCGHWFKWHGDGLPSVGSDLPCASCPTGTVAVEVSALKGFIEYEVVRSHVIEEGVRVIDELRVISVHVGGQYAG